MNAGFTNEYNFAKKLNKKTFYKLENNWKEFLKALFPNIQDNDFIECWVSKFNEKSDIKIRINGTIKGISIKMGHHNSVHLEHIDDFTDYLTKIGLDERNINQLKHFFYWSRTNKNIKSYYYKKDNYQNRNMINSAFDDFYIKFKLLSRFLFEGNTRFKYSAHAIIYGTPENFLWATRNEVIKFLLKEKSETNATIKISLLCLQVLEKENKQFIQIKWHTLENNLIQITKLRNQNKEKYTNF